MYSEVMGEGAGKWDGDEVREIMAIYASLYTPPPPLLALLLPPPSLSLSLSLSTLYAFKCLGIIIVSEITILEMEVTN